ncbi:MAG: hypothetical protein MUE36_08290 [Acidimicrobiales bacterium]|jgi:hypothetical protein|nr:hypothetical protein [Acidimicrobiales bacterium]
MMNFRKKKSPWLRMVAPAVLVARKGGKPILGIFGAAVAATALSAAASVRRESS